jgi:large subunit ribosomal protein L25
MIRDMALDPITRALLHVDFVRVLLDRKLRVSVPVEIVGTAFGVKNEGGLLNIVTHDLEIECLPAEIPPTIKVDVTKLHVHGAIRVSDLVFGASTRVLESADRVVVHVAVPKAEEVAPAAAAAVEGLVEAAPTEPEVIKKGKKEAEEGAAEAAPAKAEKAEKPEKAEKKEKK